MLLLLRRVAPVLRHLLQALRCVAAVLRRVTQVLRNEISVLRCILEALRCIVKLELICIINLPTSATMMSVYRGKALAAFVAIWGT